MFPHEFGEVEFEFEPLTFHRFITHDLIVNDFFVRKDTSFFQKKSGTFALPNTYSQ